jgi:hypothetical protein
VVVNVGRKTKRPRLGLSRGTYVDQPSPKCCSIRSIGYGPVLVNGTQVLSPNTNVTSSVRVRIDAPEINPQSGIHGARSSEQAEPVSSGGEAPFFWGAFKMGFDLFQGFPFRLR